MIVIANSTIFIGLAKIGKLYLLQKIFSKVYITKEVHKELTLKGQNKPGSHIIKGSKWIECKAPKDKALVNLLLSNLEKGEAEVLALAKELNADLLLLDEEKARKAAQLAGFKVMGIVGLLILAKDMGLIDAISPYIHDLERKNFRISQKIINEALKRSKEL